MLAAFLVLVQVPMTMESEPTWPECTVRLANGQPDWAAKSNFVRQEQIAESVVIQGSVAEGLPRSATMHGGKGTIYSRPSFTEEPLVTPNAAKKFTRVFPFESSYPPIRKAVYVGRDQVIGPGEHLYVFCRTKQIYLSEWHTVAGKRYQRMISDQEFSYRWEVRNRKSEIIRSGS